MIFSIILENEVKTEKGR